MIPTDARLKHREAHKLVLEGLDPFEKRKTVKRQAIISTDNNFEVIAREWMAAKSTGCTPRYTEFLNKRLDIDLFHCLDIRPIKNITAPELLTVVRVTEKRGALELANHALQYCSQIFMSGIATGRVDQNPALDLKGALKTHAKKNYAHLAKVDTGHGFRHTASTILMSVALFFD